MVSPYLSHSTGVLQLSDDGLHAVIPRHQHGDAVTQFSLDSRRGGSQEKGQKQTWAGLLRHGSDMVPSVPSLLERASSFSGMSLRSIAENIREILHPLFYR